MFSNESRPFRGTIDKQVRRTLSLMRAAWILNARGKQKAKYKVKVKVVSVTEVSHTKAFRGA